MYTLIQALVLVSIRLPDATITSITLLDEHTNNYTCDFTNNSKDTTVTFEIKDGVIDYWSVQI